MASWEEGSVLVKVARLSYLWRYVVMSEPQKRGAPGQCRSGIGFRCVLPAEMASMSSHEICMLPSLLVIYSVRNRSG